MNSSVETDHFQVLAIINNAVVNMGVQISLWHSIFISYQCIPRSGIAGSYGNFIFNFLRTTIPLSTLVVGLYQ